MNYYEVLPEENTFHTILADVTHRCNMACHNCYIPNRQVPDMDFAKLEAFVKKLKGRTDIRMIGAEATLRSDLPELIKMVRTHGHRPTLLTNGLKLADLPYCQSLLKSGLRSLGLSMNGVDSDKWYKILDNGKYAKYKIQALENCLQLGMVVHINCILCRGVNEEAPKKLLNLVLKLAKKHNRVFKNTYPIMLRFKSIGEIGRYMKDSKPFSLDELKELICQQYGLPREALDNKNLVDGFSECNSLVFKFPTELGPLAIKLTDWTIDDDGVPDSGSRRRGRVTQDFKVAPFFEHVKRNEFMY